MHPERIAVVLGAAIWSIRAFQLHPFSVEPDKPEPLPVAIRVFPNDRDSLNFHVQTSSSTYPND